MNTMRRLALAATLLGYFFIVQNNDGTLAKFDFDTLVGCNHGRDFAATRGFNASACFAQ